MSQTEDAVTSTGVRPRPSTPTEPGTPSGPTDPAAASQPTDATTASGPTEPVTPSGPAGAVGDPLVAGALLTTAALLVTYQRLAGHVIPPLANFGGLTGVLGLATLRRRPRWWLGLDALVAVLYLGGSAPFLAANLAHPESPVSFLAEVFLIVALATVLIGVVLRWRSASDVARRRTVTGAVGIAAVATVGSLVAAASVVAAAQQAGDVAIVTDRSTFPERVELAAGEGVLWVDNQDPFHHTFVLDGTDVHEVLAASSSVRIPVDLAPGSYRYWCDVPGHKSMEGELDVR
jgi:plastocyanin